MTTSAAVCRTRLAPPQRKETRSALKLWPAEIIFVRRWIFGQVYASLTWLGLCCVVEQGGIEGALSGPAVAVTAPSAGRWEDWSEGYYALEAGSADDTLLLTPAATKQCQGSKEEGRKGNKFSREIQYPVFLVTSLAAPLPADRAVTCSAV